jgi:hypothetical protein
MYTATEGLSHLCGGSLCRQNVICTADICPTKTYYPDRCALYWLKIKERPTLIIMGINGLVWSEHFTQMVNCGHMVTVILKCSLSMASPKMTVVWKREYAFSL